MHHPIEIIPCKECGAKNRIQPHSTNLRPVCGRCGKSLSYSTRPSTLARILWYSVLLVALVGVVCGTIYTPSLLSKDFSELDAHGNARTRAMEPEEEKKLSDREAQLQAESPLTPQLRLTGRDDKSGPHAAAG